MANNHFIRLSALAQAVASVVRDAFGTASFWVIADVTSHTFKTASNYHYFELVEKEEGSRHIVTRFAARAWGAGSRAIEAFEAATGQRFTNNIHVLVNVSVAYHPQFGLQLQVNDIEASYTLGLIEKQRRETLAKLVAENPDIRREGPVYLTPNKSRFLPPVLQKLAVISSRASAGLNDFKHTLDNNSWGYRFDLDEYYTEVQGEAHALSLRNTLIHIFQSGIPYDAIAIIRGGGAQTDFLLFDNYLVGQAIARFPVPIITGIGHQHNTSIADLMAHTQTKTPTEAAAFIIAHNRTFETQLLSLQQNILIRTQQLFATRQQSLFTLQHQLLGGTKHLLQRRQDALQQYRDITVTHIREWLFCRQAALLGISARLAARPALVLAHRSLALKGISTNLQSWSAGYLRHRKSALAHFESVIQLVSPEAVLRRGFAMIRYKGQVVANAAQLQAGDSVQIVLAGDSLDATVTKKEAVIQQAKA